MRNDGDRHQDPRSAGPVLTPSDAVPAAGAGETAVTATAPAPWPGTETAEAIRVIRGELGAPHLPFLPQLADRGVGADPVGRTAAVLVDLPVDVQPHGWRLVDRPGRDYRRAVATLAADINLLADIAGAEEAPGPELKLSLRGPWSMAANLYLHNGERALLDAGARREIAASLAAGLAGHLSAAAVAARGARLVLEVEEPEITAVLAGTIPTSSGYRTLRAIGEQEVRAAWRQLTDAARAAGAVEMVMSTSAPEAPAGTALDGGFDGIALPAAGPGRLSVKQWEDVAEAVEAGKRIWLGIVPTADPQTALPPVTRLVDTVLRPWRELGLAPKLLRRLRLTPVGGLAGNSPATARKVLERLGAVAEVLSERAED